jgi:hypothetical protein
LQYNREQIKKGDNSNLIDCNAITQHFKKRGKIGVASLFLFCTIALQSIKLELPPFKNNNLWLHCNLLNWELPPFLIFFYDYSKIKKGRQLQFNRLQCNHKLLFLKGGNSNLIDSNAIVQNKKKGVTSLFSIGAISHCNLLNWSYLPFFYFVLLHCNLLNWSYLPFFYFARLHCNLLNWSYLPFCS